MIKEVLILGNQILRQKCKEVFNFSDPQLKNEIKDLKDTLDDFRKNNSFGRGIAAIQIGIIKRIIALNLGSETFVIINPKITSSSQEKFTMWDDCMSFPDLLVKVQRSKTITIEYQDENGAKKIWNNLSQPESELLQHEIDHLDGIMAVDIKYGEDSIIYKSEFSKNRAYYYAKVDYTID